MPRVISRHSLRKITEEKDKKLPLNFEKVEVIKKENKSNLKVVFEDTNTPTQTSPP